VNKNPNMNMDMDTDMGMDMDIGVDMDKDIDIKPPDVESRIIFFLHPLHVEIQTVDVPPSWDSSNSGVVQVQKWAL
jgi:hypothetical protein